MARAWGVLMKRLGYKQFVVQGGDWRAVVTDVMAAQAPAELLGMHSNMPGAVPPEVAEALQSGGPRPSGLSADEGRAYEQLNDFYTTGIGYAVEFLLGRTSSASSTPRTSPSRLA